MKRLLFANSLLVLVLSLGGEAFGQSCIEFRAGNGPTWSVSPEEAITSVLPCTNNICSINSQCATPHHAQLVAITGTWPALGYSVQWFRSNGAGCGVVSSGQFNRRTAACSPTPTPQYFAVARQFPNVQDSSCAGSGDPVNCVGDPINPASGSVFEVEDDVILSGSGTRFQRFYNSNGKGSAALGPGWRHSYSRHVVSLRDAPHLPYPTPHFQSPPYASQASACAMGFVQIRPNVPAWASATASWNGSSCVLQIAGQTVGTLEVYSTVQLNNPSNPILEVHAVRDDGSTIRFSAIGSDLVAQAGTSYRIQKTTTGFLLTGLDDTTEEYDEAGILQSVTTRGGVVYDLEYDVAQRLSKVTDSFGNSLMLVYDTQSKLISVNNLSGAAPGSPGSVEVQYGYDTQGRLSTVSYPGATSRTFVYENATYTKALTGSFDETNTRVSTWTYNSNGRASGASRAGGADAVTVVYPTVRSATVTDGLGAVRTFTYQQIGDQYLPVSISGSRCPTCIDGAATTYDSAGFVSSRTDYNGNRTCYAHDPTRGLELARVEGLATGVACPTNLLTYTPAPGSVQRKVMTQWHTNWRQPQVITEANRTTDFTFDSHGNVLTKTITDSLQPVSSSRTTTYSYDSFGRLLTVDGSRSDVSDLTTYTYYTCATGLECGRIQAVTNALGHATTYDSYNAYGQPLTITDPNGVLISLAYDARHRLTSRTVGTESTTLEYWPTGLLKKVRLPDLSFIFYTYDAAHRLYKIEDGQGNRIEFTLDSMGNRTAERAYDASSVLTRTHTRVYNTLSQLWKDVNAAGTAAVTTVYGYDADGNHTSTNAPLGRNSTQLYDEIDRLKQITDPATGITLFSYDFDDNLTSVTDPRGKVTSYTFNGFGELKQQVSPDTGTTASTYDAAGNLETRTDARGKMGTYTYDAINRLASIAFPDLTTTLSYDAGTNGIGLLTGASDANHSLAFTYDPQGRVTSKTQTVGTLARSVSYGYTNGNLTSLVTPSGQTITYGYTNGQITSVTLNGSTTILDQVLYEPFGPVSGWRWGNGTFAVRLYDADGKTTTVDSAGAYDYGYDDAFRITSISDLTDPLKSWTHGYDLLDRLTSASGSAETIGYAYDASGNRLSQTGTQSATYTVSATSNRLESVAGVPTRTYSYDAAGNTLSDGTNTYTYNDAGRMSSVTRSSVTTAYVYNALGQRTRKASSAGTLLFMYDEAGHLLGEYDASGSLVSETVWIGNIPVAVIRPDSSGISVYYVHSDHLNTPRRISRPGDNAIVWRWDSDPFGSDGASEDPDGDSVSFVSGLRFPGQYFDAESGLNYNYWRDGYDPTVGRYTQSDPIGLGGGVNTYAYVGGNPLWAIDSLGLETCVLVTKTPTLGIRDHSALYVSRGDAGKPLIYDPSGSYARSVDPHNGDLVTGKDADIKKWSDFYKKLDGTGTEKICKNTTEQEEKDFVTKAEEVGPGYGPSCAQFVSTVIGGSRLFPRVAPGTLFPGNLFRAAKKNPGSNTDGPKK